METITSSSVLFDYTSFLAASCKKKWTFMEALNSVAPIFSVAWNESIKPTQTAEERLWQEAMQALSPSHSDEANLVALVSIAKQQGIDELRLVMPYSLEPEQLDTLRRQSRSTQVDDDGEHLIIQL
ncbi:transporter [Vibrio xiamenensis]|nr:transporter [Vibrio xiamenensis]